MLKCLLNSPKHCSEEVWYLSAYGSKYSTKAKECDVRTVQKPLEDKCILYSVYPYLLRETERWKTFLVNVNKLIRKPGEIGMYDNWELVIFKVVLSWNDCRARRIPSASRHVKATVCFQPTVCMLFMEGSGRLDERGTLFSQRQKYWAHTVVNNVFWLQ